MESSGQMALPLGRLEQGQIVTYRFTVPGLPPSKNTYDGLPPQWKNSMKHKWIRAVIREVEAQDMPRGVPRIGLSAVLVFPTKRRRDPQNYAPALWNWIPDALQKCGVIHDDRDGIIDFGPNLGIQFALDERKSISPDRRKRTQIAITLITAA